MTETVLRSMLEVLNDELRRQPGSYISWISVRKIRGAGGSGAFGT